MKNILHSLFLLLISIVVVSNCYSQSTGTLTFTVTTSNAGGAYQPKHIMAAWIETSSGTFVETRLKKGTNNMYLPYLTHWKTASNGTTVPTDANTGATIPTHASPNNPVTVTWDGKNQNGNVVTDGTYRLCIELTDKNATGNYSYFTFEKGPNTQNQTPANAPSFSNMSLNWVSTVNIESNTNDNVAVSAFPNPFTTETNVSFNLKEAECVTTNIYSVSGQLIKSFITDCKNTGINKISWNGSDNNGNKVPVGVYYYNINTKNDSFTGKIVYTK